MSTANALCYLLVSAFLCINDPISCFLLLNMTPFLLVHHHGSKMLRSESNSSITQSPIGWQISHFLTLLHEPDSGMCVCTSECVPLGVFYCSCVCVCVWEASSWATGSTHNQPSFTSSWFSCMQLSAVTFSEALLWDPRRQISSFLSLSACNELFWAQLLLQFTGSLDNQTVNQTF